MKLTTISRKPLSFVAATTAAVGGLLGLFVGTANGSGAIGILAGGALLAVLALILPRFDNEALARWLTVGLFILLGSLFGGLPLMLLGIFVGWFFGWFIFWLYEGRYRAKLPPYATAKQVLWHYTFRVICGAIFIFLITPIIVVMPLSFNAEDFFTFTPEMLRLDPDGYSLKHYRDFFTNNEWQRSFKNSLIIAPIATIISVSLGTLAAIGLSQSHVPGRRAIMAILISPMIVPLIISATGMFFFYSDIGNFLEGTVGLGKNFVGYVKVILAHAVLGIPFVIITVTATLVGFDRSLTRAAANMGANPVTTFFRVQMPLILPGVISGGLFAFITSFDEVVVVLFVGSASQKTLPWQMFTGLREQISPTILAVATILVVISIALLTTVELLRRRSERLRGMSPG
ncbi:ABC transporter permease [Roseovarius nubinhibens]|uniref:Polyamine ABC transporter, permease protein n=2 Tax=Roseovarius nubinhibens TaxID=314263 RepID=A3SLH3_ROSNI|nr:ABC transporter permease [Roseovarius nubinhibens]EAP78204.1 polyamine ABC transporter, permease protein [Roseovarius nubinhibens ISM]HAR50533.1 ABC transporter permease [Roseovarius nubinhibens]|tara:strand:+ start:5638 stop:6843 length:1206 start_codon:yes stop_codon:yes gene_type:complete